MKDYLDMATEDFRWKDATAKEAQELIKEYKENSWWYNYEEWAHSGLDNPHKEN